MTKREKRHRLEKRRRVLRRRIGLSVICTGFLIGICASLWKNIAGQAENFPKHFMKKVIENLEDGNSGKSDTILMENVPVIMQNPELPSGCEATAAVMLLSAYGITVDKEMFANALPWCELEENDGKLYACDPQEAFVGSPYSTGYGVFAGIVCKTMQEFIDESDRTLYAKDISGASEQTILNYIDMGKPVCIWVTMDLREVEYKSGWWLKSGENYTEEYFDWPAGEHCMVLTGYQGDKVTVNDPLQGQTEYDL